MEVIIVIVMLTTLVIFNMSNSNYETLITNYNIRDVFWCWLISIVRERFMLFD